MSARNGKPKHHKAGQSSQDDAFSPERALEELSKACKRKDYDIQTIRSLVGALQSSFVKRGGGPHRNKAVEELESTESRLEIVRAQLEASKTQLYNINLQVDKQCQPVSHHLHIVHDRLHSVACQPASPLHPCLAEAQPPQKIHDPCPCRASKTLKRV